MKKGYIYRVVCLAVLTGGFFSFSMFSFSLVSRGEEAFRTESSRDGKMWTMVEKLPEGKKADGMPVFWYDAGTEYLTGKASEIRETKPGEHYYQYNRTGVIPVGKWQVEHTCAYCVSGWTKTTDAGHDIILGNPYRCGLPYFSGWMAYCADCGEKLLQGNVHMSYEAVKSMDTIDTDKGYYFLCPCMRRDNSREEIPGSGESGYTRCGHLEKYWEPAPHTCRGISYNRYRVVYDANGGEGTMDPSFHMYNNETVFEGKRITPGRKLSLCTYDRAREGYLFAGWNTKPDGRGTHYDDGAEIFNLVSENYTEGTEPGTVVLYAQWQRPRSTLKIDANGGRYRGENTVTGVWGSCWKWEEALLTPPAGYRVTFQAGGGRMEESEIRGRRFFLGWELVGAGNGELSEDCYRFTGSNGSVDVIRAVYGTAPLYLPEPVKNGYSFGGWYFDSACTRLAGYGGEAYVPGADVTMYAKWVELKLTVASDDPKDPAKGSVKLTWEQPDGMGKICRIFQKTEKSTEYEQIFLEEKEKQESLLERSFSLERQTGRFTVPSSGFYSLTAEGAQGENYKTYTGGPGGRVSGVFYLEKGEVLSVTVGGQDGYNGGGTATDFGNGGGCTIVSSDRKGILLIAGGGGGATSGHNGLGGGSETYYHLQEFQGGGTGMAGGGGGCRGGSAGTRIVHQHTAEKGCFKDGGFDVLTSGGFSPVWKEWREEEKDSQGDDVRKNKYFSGRIGGPGQYIPVNGNSTLELGVWIYGKGAHLLDGKSYIQAADQRGIPFFTTAAGQLRQEWESFERRAVQPGSGGIYNGWPPVANVAVYTDWSKSDPQGDEYDILESYHLTYPVFYENGTARTAKVRLDANYQNPVFSGDYNTEYYPPEGLWRSDILSRRGYGDRPLLFSERSFWWGMSGVHFRYEIDIPEGTGGIYIYAEGMMDELVGKAGEKVTQAASDCAVRFDRVRLSGSRILECDVKDVNVPAYGGSNYVNERYAVSAAVEAGVKNGDGGAHIRAEITGFGEAGGMHRLQVQDLAPPFAVEEESVAITAAGTGRVKISFGETRDRGTLYLFRAESFSVSTGEKMCDSNIVPYLMKSGVKGYCYLISGSRDTELKNMTASKQRSLPFTENREITADIDEKVRYLHIAAVDYAGNLSDTVHIKLNQADTAVVWKVSTDRIRLGAVEGGEDYGNLYPGKEEFTYYVRADGKTPFQLSFRSFLHGPARKDYQINQQIFDVRTELQTQRHGTILPYSRDVSLSSVPDPSEFLHWSQGSAILADASRAGATRSGGSGNVTYYQAFVLSPDQHGRMVTVTPGAGAVNKNMAEYSSADEDRNHGIRLMADGQGPVIKGLEELPDWKLIDREKDSVVLELTAEDPHSGVREFYLEVRNKDNFLAEKYLADEEGRLQINITEAEPVFSGDFMITAYAVDNVGNETSIQRDATEFALIAEVTRILPPHEPVFKRGESGLLHIEVWGYAEKLEVVFPEFLSRYNQVYSYEAFPQYMKKETIQFMIPLDAGEDQYEITVRAYKGDRQLEEHPSISMVGVEGSVLDELRTRLR